MKLRKISLCVDCDNKDCYKKFIKKEYVTEIVQVCKKFVKSKKDNLLKPDMTAWDNADSAFDLKLNKL